MDYDKLLEKYPFLSVIDYNGDMICGVISIHGKTHLTMYVISEMRDEKTVQYFFNLCEKWWNLSDRKSISLFLKKEMEPFRRYLKIYSKSSINEIKGRIPPQFHTKKKKSILISFL